MFGWRDVRRKYVMEVELKYQVGNKATLDEIANDAELARFEEKGSREGIQMKAVYFDTKDRSLSEACFAFRVRLEGERTFATLKWKGSVKGALHTRQEINVPVSDETCLISPNPEVFNECEMGKPFMDAIGKKKLYPLVEIASFRRRFRVEYGESLIEVSIDEGEIITEKGNEPISEVEFELFAGNEEKLEELGKKIADKYGLKPGKKSKYARGLALLS